MNKTLKIYIIILVLLIVGVAFIDSKRPKPIDWTPTYSLNDKIPFGLYVFDQESRSLFKNSKIEKINTTPYEFFTSNFNYNDTIQPGYNKNGTFLYVDEIADIDTESINELLTYVSYGNKAFISSKDFPRALLDTLKLNLTTDYYDTSKFYNGTLNSKLGKKEYFIDEGASFGYFDKIDTTQTTALGYVRINTPKINFIKVKFMDGEIMLHCQPAAFTNFHLLKGDHYEYAQNVLSYIPRGNIYWYTTQAQSSSSISDSPMRFILSQPALKWAWWLLLLGILVFIVFNAKRKQRIVPIIKPLTNTSVEFIKTIGNLYLQEEDYENIINKKIIYFLDKVRNDFLIDTSSLDENFINRLHQKSGKKLEDIKTVVNLIKYHKNSPNQSVEQDLIKITNAIEKIIL